MNVKILPEMQMVNPSEPKVQQDPKDPTVIHVSYQAYVRATGRYNIIIEGVPKTGVDAILNTVKFVHSTTKECFEEAVDTSDKPCPCKHEETETEDKPMHGNAPPKRGICRRCGENRPINRLMLCYRCWVITNLEEEANTAEHG